MANNSIPNKIADSIIKNTIDLERFSESVKNKIVKILDSAQGEIIGQLAKIDPTAPDLTAWKQERLTKLNAKISEILDGAYGDIKKQSGKELKGSITPVANKTTKDLNTAIGVNIFDVTLTPELLGNIATKTLIDGHIVGDWWDKQSDDAKKNLEGQMNKVMQQLEIGMVKGEAIGEMISRIRGTKLTPGVMAISKREAAALVRTSVMQVAQATRMEVYNQNQDIMKGYEVIATLDARTTPLCRSLDRKQYDLNFQPINGNTMPYPAGGPPFHWNCRTTVIPITKSYRELAKDTSLSDQKKELLDTIPLGERASMDGPVEAAKDYNEWLQAQPEALQQEVLGPTRWNLWKSNKLAMEDLVHQNGRQLTLDELKAKLSDGKEGIIARRVALFDSIKTAAGKALTADDFNLYLQNMSQGQEGLAVIQETGYTPQSLFDAIHAGESTADKFAWTAVTEAQKNSSLFKDFGIDNLLCEIENIDALNVIGEDFARIFNKYSNLPGLAQKDLKGFMLQDLKGVNNNKGVLGNYSQINKRIQIAAQHKLNGPITKGEWNAAQGVASTARHELGHHLLHEMNTEARDEFKKIYWSHDKSWWKKEVSGYAGSKDRHEAFAEAFSLFTHPEYKPGILNKELEDFFTKLLSGEKNMAAVEAVEKASALENELLFQSAEMESSSLVTFGGKQYYDLSIPAEKAQFEAIQKKYLYKYQDAIVAGKTPAAAHQVAFDLLPQAQQDAWLAKIEKAKLSKKVTVLEDQAAKVKTTIISEVQKEYTDLINQQGTLKLMLDNPYIMDELKPLVTEGVSDYGNALKYLKNEIKIAEEKAIAAAAKAAEEAAIYGEKLTAFKTEQGSQLLSAFKKAQSDLWRTIDKIENPQSKYEEFVSQVEKFKKENQGALGGKKVYQLHIPEEKAQFDKIQNAYLQKWKTALVEGKTPAPGWQHAYDLLPPDKQALWDLKVEAAKAKVGQIPAPSIVKPPSPPISIIKFPDFKQDEIDSIVKKVIDSMPHKQIDQIVEDYTSTGYQFVNEFLRSGKPVQGLQDDIDSLIKTMDKAFEKAPETMADGHVYRVVNDFAKFGKEGDIFIDKAYMSTSQSLEAHEKLAKQWALVDKEKGYQTIQVEINIPKGSKILPLQGDLGDFSFAEQKEIVLPRGSAFKVTKIEGNKVYLDLIPKALDAEAEAGQLLDSFLKTSTGDKFLNDYIIFEGKQNVWNAMSSIEKNQFIEKSGFSLQPIKIEGMPTGAPQAAAEAPGLQFKDMVKYGEQQGSNKGGFYYEKSNPADRYYIKTPANEEIARNELLASKLYQAAGVTVPELQIIDIEGQTGIASRVMDDVKKLDIDAFKKGLVSGVGDGFAVDAWLGDWDVVGLGYDNLLQKGQQAVRIDVGGSLRFRAQGTAKGSAFGKEVTELSSMRDARTNSQAASVFKHIKKGDLENGVRKVLSVSDDTIRQLVAEYGPKDKKIADDLIDTLIARKQDLAKQFPDIAPKEIVKEVPMPADTGKVINNLEKDQIISSRGTGYSIPVDKEDIEDHNVLLWREKAANGNQVIQAQMKVMGTAAERLDKFASKVVATTLPEENFLKINDVYNKVVTTIKGVVTQNLKNLPLRPQDIERAGEAIKVYNATISKMDDLIGKGTLKIEQKQAFINHYKKGIDFCQEVLTNGLGSVKQIIPTGHIPELGSIPLTKVGAKAIPQEEGIAFSSKKGVSKKTITNGHVIESTEIMSSGSSIAYAEADVEGVRIRYWPNTSNVPYAQRGTLELLTKEADPEIGTAKIFQAMETIGVPTARASIIDNEVLYLRQIIYHIDSSMSMVGKMDEIMAKPIEQVLPEMRKLASTKAKVPDITKLKSYMPEGERPGYGQGLVIRQRPDLVNDPKFQEFRGTHFVKHYDHSHRPFEQTIDAILNTGGNFISTSNKIRMGMDFVGWSPESDLRSGGASYFFTRIQPQAMLKDISEGSAFVWDADILRRVDAITYSGDRFGRTIGEHGEKDYIAKNRKSGVSDWKSVSSHSSNETNFKNTLSIFDRLKCIVAKDSNEKKRVIEVFKKHGYKEFPDGRSFDSVIITAY